MNGTIIIPFILLCIIYVLYLYHLAVIKEGKIINVLVPYIIISLPTLYVFEIFYLYLTNGSDSISEYLFFYCCYILYLSAFVISYLYTQNKSDEKPVPYAQVENNYGLIAVGFTLLGFLTYLPVLVEFKEYILQPRRIYELTRTGYGIYFYPSLMFSQLGIITAFFLLRKLKLIALTLIAINVFLIFLHGNKGPIFNMFIAFILFQSYIVGKNIKLAFLIKAFTAIAVIVSAFFVYTYNGGNPLINMAYYSDYTRNAVLLAHSNFDFTYGKLLLEGEIYSRIPRALWPQKPEDFGSLYLAKVFFPEAFYRNQGAPAFGYGEIYADFGYFTPLYLIITGTIKGVMTKFFMNKTEQTRSAHYFILFIFCAGISIIPVSMGWLLPEHLVIALAVYCASRFVLTRKKLVLFKNVEFVWFKKDER